MSREKTNYYILLLLLSTNHVIATKALNNQNLPIVTAGSQAMVCSAWNKAQNRQLESPLTQIQRYQVHKYWLGRQVYAPRLGNYQQLQIEVYRNNRVGASRTLLAVDCLVKS